MAKITSIVMGNYACFQMEPRCEDISAERVESFADEKTSPLKILTSQVASIPLKKFLCSDCGWLLTSYSSFRRHVRTVHGKGKQLPKKCPLCERAFANSEDFEGRVAWHCNSKPFLCGVCGTKFAYRKTLKRHASSAHRKPEESVTCSTCGQVFSTERYPKEHAKIYDVDAERYACTQCWKKLKFRASLIKHEKGCKK